MSEFVIENSTVISYHAKQEEVIVPDGVTVIGEGAFKGCASIRSIALPDSIERIEKHAFKGCRKLEHISMPSGLRSIGDYAFHRCHSLREAVLPDAVKKLGACVFLYCDNLRYVEMPGVTEFGKQTFLNDVNLEELVLSEDVELSSIRDCFTGCNRIKKITLANNRDKVYDITNIVDILAGKEQVLPIIQTIVQDICSILKIEDGVLVEYLNNVKNVELPEGITAIGKSCFYDKRGVQSVVFPKSLKKIRAGAFRGCISLEKVEFLQEEVELEESAFLNCSALHEIVLPKERKYVLTGLKEICGSEVTELVKKIHGQILENFVISGTMLIKYRGCETKVIVPDGITIIGQRAFAGNESIDRIELPGTVTCIEREAFADCVLLQSIAMPEHLEEIEEAAFENCVKLIRIQLQGTVTAVPASCFKRCRALQEVYAAESLRVIEELAFYGCAKLKRLELPEKLEEIGDMAFYGCAGFKEGKFPPSLKKVGKLAFKKSGMEQNLVQLLTSGKFAGIEEFSASEKFSGTENEESIYLRNVFAKEAYSSGVLEIPEGTEVIEAYAYFGNDKITSVKLPESLKEIGEAAFYGCRNLVHIQFPKGNLVLQKSCFEKCILLEEVTCHLECVPQRAFAWCRKLKRLEVNGVQKVCKEAFEGCMGLCRICLEEARYIGKHAFAMCDGLEQVTVGEGIFFDDFSFLDCGNLKCISFHAPIEEGHFMKSGSFRGCTSLETIAYCRASAADRETYCLRGYDSLFDETLPQFVKRMYASAVSVFEIDAKRKMVSYDGFADKVTIPYGIKAIDKEVFRDKENLKEIRIPDSVEEIGLRAFDKTQWLRDRIEENPMVVWKGILIDGTACRGKVVIPPCIRKIAGWAFAGNMQLTELQFTKHTQIEEFAFRNCIYLEKIILEDGTEYTLGNLSDRDRRQPPVVAQIIGECYNCFKMEGDTLAECTGNIGQLKLPGGIKRIGKHVFKESNLLTSLILNGEVTEIEEGAFLQCKWLQTMKNAQSIVRIGKKAFSACIRLEEISGLKKEVQIGENAFEHCISLPLEIKNAGA